MKINKITAGKMIRITLLFVIVTIIASCGFPPPKNTQDKSFLEVMYEFFSKVKASDMKETTKEIIQSINYIIAIKKDDEAVFTPALPTMSVSDFDENSDVFGYYAGDNKYILHKDVYLASYRKRMLFSFDLINWYNISPLNHQDTHQNLIFDMKFSPMMESENKLLVPFEMVVRVAKDLIPYPNLSQYEMQKRQVIPFKKGIKVSDDKHFEDGDTDLEKVILSFKKETYSNFAISCDSNLFDMSVTQTGDVVLKFKTDLYLYITKNYFISISFDNKNWGLNIFSFDIDFKQKSEGIADDYLFYKYDIKLKYKG